MDQLGEDLTDYQRAFLKKYPYPQIFAVISWGCSATSWLATVLNRHPDIFCVHAANLHWQVLGNCERLDGVPYIRVIASQGHAHAAAGSVHGLSRHLVPECRRIFGDKFNAAVVVREPMARIHSQLALYRDFDGLQVWDLGYVDAILARAGIAVAPEDYPARQFVHAANMLNAILDEREAGHIYRCEDLTSDGQVLGGFIEEITRGKVSPTSEWVESAVQSRKVNEHAGHRVRRDLDGWQIDVIRRVVEPQTWDLYEELGYARPEFVGGRTGEVSITSAACLE